MWTMYLTVVVVVIKKLAEVDLVVHLVATLAEHWHMTSERA